MSEYFGNCLFILTSCETDIKWLLLLLFCHDVIFSNASVNFLVLKKVQFDYLFMNNETNVHTAGLIKESSITWWR